MISQFLKFVESQVETTLIDIIYINTSLIQIICTKF